MSQQLLDDLAAQMGLFISDLRKEDLREKVLDRLLQISVSDYSLSDWSECLNYVFEEKATFEQYDQIVSVLHRIHGL